MFQAIQANQAAFMNAIFTGNPNLGLPTGGPGLGGPAGAMAGGAGRPRAPPGSI